VAILDVRSLQEALQEDQEKMKRLWIILAPRIITLSPDALPEFKSLTHEKVALFCRMCMLRVYKDGEEVDMQTGGVLLRGRLSIRTQKDASAQGTAEVDQILGEQYVAPFELGQNTVLASKDHEDVDCTVVLHLHQCLWSRLSSGSNLDNDLVNNAFAECTAQQKRAHGSGSIYGAGGYGDELHLDAKQRTRTMAGPGANSNTLAFALQAVQLQAKRRSLNSLYSSRRNSKTRPLGAPEPEGATAQGKAVGTRILPSTEPDLQNISFSNQFKPRTNTQYNNGRPHREDPRQGEVAGGNIQIAPPGTTNIDRIPVDDPKSNHKAADPTQIESGRDDYSTSRLAHSQRD